MEYDRPFCLEGARGRVIWALKCRTSKPSHLGTVEVDDDVLNSQQPSAIDVTPLLRNLWRRDARSQCIIQVGSARLTLSHSSPRIDPNVRRISLFLLVLRSVGGDTEMAVSSQL